MQTTQEIIETIKGDISAKFKIPFNDKVTVDTNLIEAGMIDSFGVVELICYLEERFAVKFTDDDLLSSEIAVVSGMADLVQKRRG